MGVTRSRSSPSISAITAALARPAPMDVARSAAVEPAGSSRSEPSGSRTAIVADMGGDRTGGPPDPPIRFSVRWRRSELDAEEGRRLRHALARRRGVVEGGEGGDRVEVVVERRPHLVEGAVALPGATPAVDP